VIRRAAKHAFSRAVYLIGRRAHDGGITILSYHSIDEHGTPLSVSPTLFRAQMQALVKEDCVALNMAQVAEHLRAQRPFPRRAVAITFDDGFANVLTEAAPIMAEYGFVGTVYVITGMVGRKTRWIDRGIPLPSLPLLTWPQITELQERGFEIGAHSVTHGFLTQYPSDNLKHELTGPKGILERELGTAPSTFAYPQGDYNRRVVATVRSTGYVTAVTIDQGRATLYSDPFTLPRLLVSGNTTPAMMKAFVSPTIGPAYKLINFAFKRVLGRKRWPRRAPGEIDSTGSEPMASET
jgi:peptidoglycan/xylan/chitin deacetylase (PgdA/CDA1 family)